MSAAAMIEQNTTKGQWPAAQYGVRDRDLRYRRTSTVSSILGWMPQKTR
jgi:hypothetical protein